LAKVIPKKGRRADFRNGLRGEWGKGKTLQGEKVKDRLRISPYLWEKEGETYKEKRESPRLPERTKRKCVKREPGWQS